MDKVFDVGVIVGSLRKDSINRKVANALVVLAPSRTKLSIIEIGQLPMYNQDGDENPPAAWTAFRERILAADAVLFVTPRAQSFGAGGLRTPLMSARDPMARAPGTASPARSSVRRRRYRRIRRQPPICGRPWFS